MRIVLDTHALVWAVTERSLLSQRAHAAIRDSAAPDRIVSCASLWEIATKVRMGKWAAAEKLEHALPEILAVEGYALAAVDAPIALRAGRMLGAHGDPFDRIIAAHALMEDVPVISADSKLDAFGVRRIW